jgi:hypothetical protein
MATAEIPVQVKTAPDRSQDRRRPREAGSSPDRAGVAGKIYLVAATARAASARSTPTSYAPRPRKQGHRTAKTVADFPSFAAYLDKHGMQGETEISAQRHRGTFTAVIDAGTKRKQAGAGTRSHAQADRQRRMAALGRHGPARLITQDS